MPQRAREAALREDLFTFRQCLAQYRADKGHDPPSIRTLVSERYLRKVPMNPFTGSPSWRVIRNDDGTVADVRSAYDGPALDGSRYSNW
jgi:general secretion pathway protein G